MAVRSTMTSLIARVRQMCGDVATPQDFTDQDVQDVCDAHRMDVRYELLSPAPDIQPGQGGSSTASFVWAAYFSTFQHWEDDVVLQGINTSTFLPWTVLTPVVSEPIAGRWTFAVTLPQIATPPAQWPPVYATGKVYDLYRIAAALLERRIALKSFTLFDFNAQGVSMHLNQVLDRWDKLRASYLAQAWTHTVELLRDDLAPDRGGTFTHGTRTDSQAGLLPGPGPTVSGARGAGGEK